MNTSKGKSDWIIAPAVSKGGEARPAKRLTKPIELCWVMSGLVVEAHVESVPIRIDPLWEYREKHRR